MKISINNTLLDTTEILSLINNQSKLAAIKLVREQLQVGLKESKDIVENLERDPKYYNGKNHIIDKLPPELFNDSNNIKISQTIENYRQQKTPFIERSKNSSKTYIIICLIVVIVILSYLYSTK